MSNDLVVLHFNYADLDPDVASGVRNAAVEIRASNTRCTDEAMTIGRALLRVKEHLGHGRFGQWLEIEFGWSERTAQNYMLLAETYGDNPQRVADLPVRLLYRLQAPSVPTTTRAQVLSLVERGERLSEKRVGDLIAEGKEAAQAAEREAARRAGQQAKSPEQLRKEEQNRKRRDRRSELEELKEKKKLNDQQQAADDAALLVFQTMPRDKFDHLLALLDRANERLFFAALKRGKNVSEPGARQ